MIPTLSPPPPNDRHEPQVLHESVTGTRTGGYGNAPPERPLVLCVDDDPAMRLLLHEALEQASFTVEEAASGEEALMRMENRLPDLVLLDVNMPGIDGFETCARIRRLGGAALLPIVMLTGLDDVKSIEQAYHTGATDFIAKPFNWAILPHRLRYILRASQAIQEEHAMRNMLGLILDSIPVRVYWKDRDLRYLGCNHCFAEDAGFSEPWELAGRRDADLPWSNQADLLEAEDREVMDKKRTRRGYEQIRTRHSGERLYVHSNKLPFTDGEGQVIGILGTFEDITARKETEARIQVLAQRDSLTGLPNRTLFADRLRHAMTQTQRAERLLGLMFLDLDRFKTVNDTLGHHQGDELLIQVAERLRICMRESDTVARLGGDEFTAILEMLSNIEDCLQVARKILKALEVPFRLDQRTVFISASIGIAIYPLAGENAEILIRNADTAMYRAKEEGGGRFSLYSSDMSANAAMRLDMENALRQALGLQQFELWYQPLYTMQSERLTGFEVLLRWRRPGAGVILPGEFIPSLEETGQIIPVGEWVLRTACRQASLWRDQGLEPACISVNLSSRQFNDPELTAKVVSALEQADLEPHRLELELTESCLVDDHEAANKVLHRIKSMGVRVSLDDFGTGYSSMNYLKHFPLDALKIDRSFIKDLPDDRDSIAITNAIIALASSLHLNVMAEGVETREQLDHIRAQGGDGLQGFLLSPPLAVNQATGVLQRTRSSGPQPDAVG